MQNTNMINEDAVKEKYLRGNNAKIKAAKIAAAAMIITALILSRSLFGAAGTQTKIWAYDADEILSESTIDAINAKSSALYNATDEKAEIVVVVEKESGKNRELYKRAEKLFKDYDVSGDGMLFIIAVPEKEAPPKNFFEEWGKGVGEFFGNLFGGDRYSYAYFMGRNVDHSLSVKKDEIFANYFNASYAAEDYNAAVLDTFNAFVGEFERYFNVNASEPAAYAGKQPPLYQIMKTVSAGVVLMVILFAAILVMGALFGRKRNYGVKRVYKKFSWF